MKYVSVVLCTCSDVHVVCQSGTPALYSIICIANLARNNTFTDHWMTSVDPWNAMSFTGELAFHRQRIRSCLKSGSSSSYKSKPSRSIKTNVAFITMKVIITNIMALKFSPGFRYIAIIRAVFCNDYIDFRLISLSFWYYNISIFIVISCSLLILNYNFDFRYIYTLRKAGQRQH